MPPQQPDPFEQHAPTPVHVTGLDAQVPALQYICEQERPTI
jgi:hypothetical protein